MKRLLAISILVTSLLIGGCASYYVIPEPLDEQLDRTLRFSELRLDPEKHKGKTIPLGGVVLRAKNLKEGTLIEVLQLPLSRSDQPVGIVEASEGRFLVLDPDHRDTAVLKNRRITVVGEVIGKKVQLIDECEYPYPYLSAKFINIWPETRGYAYSRAYDYPGFYRYGYPGPYYPYYGGAFLHYGHSRHYGFGPHLGHH